MRILVILFTVFFLSAPNAADAGSSGSDVQLAETLMECMTKCIQYEGGNTADNKATCKSRCASSASMSRGPKRDCGSEFKACNRACGKDKACLKQCRAARRNCY